MKNRRYDYDVLRVCSMLGVIYLHVAAGALRSWNYPVLWNFSNFFACLSTPAVPLFFMMSGALLLKEEKTADLGLLFRKRIPKVLVPLLTYSAVTLLYSVVRNNAAGALESLSRLLNTPVSVPYWFLYALIPMYLISPMLKKMVDGLSDAHWNYMMALWVVLTLGLYTVRTFVPAEYELVFTEHWTLNLNMIGGYLGYFLLGAYLERWERLPSRKILVVIIAATLAVSVLGTRWDTYTKLMYLDRFTNYLTLFTFLLSAAIFLLAKSCLRGKEEKGKLLPLLSGVSFAVYLLHPLAIGAGEKLWTLLFDTMGPATVLQQLGFYAAITLVCILSAVILASIPGVCYLFTGQTYATACKSCNLQALFRKKDMI
jgi:surface polysaccharide O-acyltransferase-like enzyme